MFLAEAEAEAEAGAAVDAAELLDAAALDVVEELALDEELELPHAASAAAETTATPATSARRRADRIDWMCTSLSFVVKRLADWPIEGAQRSICAHLGADAVHSDR
jgi:hypothetical protein